MFNLEQAIQNWKRKLRSNPAFEDGDVAELESHLREEVERLKAEGLPEEEAFNKASEEIGELENLGLELYKTRATKPDATPPWKQSSWAFKLLPNYLKVAIRHFKTNFANSFLNIAGLAIGVSICLLILIYIWFEYSYDNFHDKAEQIYRVTSTIRYEGNNQLIASAGGPVGPTLKSELPEVRNAARLFRWGFLFQKNDLKFQERNIFYADSTFFDVFSFPLIKGDPKTALKAPYSVVLTQDMARKYFGEQNPVGQTITADRKHLFTVQGVMKNIPENSHLQFDALVSMTTMERLRPGRDSLWSLVGFFTYIMVPEQHETEQITKKINEVAYRYTHERLSKLGLDGALTLNLEPLSDIYLHSDKTGQAGPTGNVSNLYIFIIVAVFILGIACINYVNLSTARSIERAKEVGIRKAIGARRTELIKQFFTESFILVTISIAISISLAWMMAPLFEEVIGKSINRDFLFSREILTLAAGLIPFLSVLAGGYPAFVLVRFEPVRVLSGKSPTGWSGGSFRKALVVFQFCISIVLIVGTLVVYRQMEFVREMDLGIKSDQIITINFAADPEVQQRREVLKQIFKGIDGVKAASMSSTTPGRRYGLAGLFLESNEADMEMINLHLYQVDFDFTSQYGLEIIAGRPFSRSFVTDPSGAMIINETAVKKMGYSSPKEAIGKEFEWINKEGKVIGVMKDFNYSSLHQPVEPMALWINPAAYFFLSLTIEGENISAVIDKIERVWKEEIPHRPFNYSFLDDSLEQQYKADQQFGKLILFFSILAIVIACLGLFGLTSFSIYKRRKEIGIRKVLGAPVRKLVGLLTRDFMKLVVAGFMVGIPLAWYIMNHWLLNFAYRIDLGIELFLLAGIILITIAIAAVSYQSIKAAMMNPVKSLRSE